MAVYYFRNTGSNAWGTVTNWSLSDGGPADGAVPTLTDDVFFTVNSGDCILTTNRVCKNLTFDGYVNTFNTNATLSIYGNIDFITTGFTLAGTSEWQVRAGSTSFTSNGKPLPSPLRYNHSSVGANTIVGDLILERSLFIQLASNAPINGSSGTETIYVGNNLTTIFTSRFLQGTINVVMNGTGTISTATGGYIKTNLTINTSGTITISGIVYFEGATLTYVQAENVITTGSTIISNSSATWDTDGIIWNNVTFNTSQTFTSNMTVRGTFASSNGNTYNGANLILKGNLSINQLTLGTTVFRYQGSGFWTGGGWIGNVMYIETDGTLWIATGTYGSNTGTPYLYYVKGNITPNSILQINSSAWLYGFGNGKVVLNTLTMLANCQLYLDDMFWGTPEVKTQINAQSTSRLRFTSYTRQRKAFFVSLKNVITVPNILNVINRDGNRGGNSGVIFGDSGMNGFSLAQKPTQVGYSFDNGFKTGGMTT